MKQIEHDKATIVDWPPLNETQKRLRAVLEYWGPNGERHFDEKRHGFSGLGISGNRLCVMQAFKYLFGRCDGGRGSMVDRASTAALNRAAEEQGFICMASCSDSGFENARKMVLRAIELAA